MTRSRPNGRPRLKFWWSWLDDLDATAPDDAVECPYCYELTIGNGDDQRVIGEGVFCWPVCDGKEDARAPEV